MVRAEDNADSAALPAVAAARSGDWPQAYASAAQSKDKVLLKIVRWLDYTRPTPGSRFAELAAFIDQNPDWPLQKKLLRRAEEALTGESDEGAADWLKRHPPIGGVGKRGPAPTPPNPRATPARTPRARRGPASGSSTPSSHAS